MLRRFTNGSGTTILTYPFGIEEHQYSGAGANQSNTSYYFLAGHLLGSLDSNGTQFYLTDAQGSLVSSFTNAAGGATMKSNQLFGPYGNVRYNAGSLNTAKGFIGQYNDGTGLDYFNARYYDPIVGVFLSADTVQGNAQGMNPYGYVNGNPETHSDPSGHYMGTSIPLSQQGGAIGYIVPNSGIITTEVNNGSYIGSITGINGQSTPTSGNMDVHTQTLQAAADPYNPLTDANNSPLAKLSRDIGLPALQQVWNDPNATWQDKLGAIWNFLGTNANNAFQLAMIFGGGPEGDAGDVLAACGGLSFAPDTLVATAQGEQAIGTMQVGEKVWAYNSQTHKMELEPIQHVWLNHDNDLVDLTLTTTTVAQHGKIVTKTSETLHTNKKHPFLTKEKGFLPVSQITLGMHVLRADGTYGAVTGWKVVSGAKTMYNLEVAQDHTYTVGTDQWIVHNCGGGGLLDLLNELKASGANFTEKNVVGVTRSAETGFLNWLEKGTADSGLVHIMARHADDFAKVFGITSQEDVSKLILDTLGSQTPSGVNKTLRIFSDWMPCCLASAAGSSPV